MLYRRSAVLCLCLIAPLLSSKGLAKPDSVEGVNVPEGRIPQKIHDNRYPRTYFPGTERLAKDEMRQIIKNSPEELRQQIYILKTQMELLEDKMLYGKTIDIIESEEINAEWALKKTESNVRSMFQSVEDPYLKERASDITHIADRIVRHLVGEKSINIADIDRRVILVAEDLSPAETSQINLERVKGFVTDRGGRTSHTSIVARTLEIPAVTGLDNATRQIQNDDLIVIDGTTGIVIVNPTDETLEHFEELQERYQHVALDDKGRRFNTDVLEAWELGALLEMAEVTAVAALARTESRGGHYREDYSKRDDRNWLRHSLAWRKDGNIELGCKPVTITDYEPKERVY